MNEDSLTLGPRVIDITGHRYGRLVVLGPQGKNRRGRWLWRCRCDCGNLKEGLTSNVLRRGETRSCGCLHRERAGTFRRYALTGKEFGSLTVLAEAGVNARGNTLWLCRCVCGAERAYVGWQLVSGKTKSCGCQMRRLCAEVNTTHGMSRSREYEIWKGMRQRCQNENYTHYDYYGGRGIVVCERWNDFENFYADMGPAPSRRHSLDRIDVNGSYEPGNCRWATPKQQARNRRERDGYFLYIRPSDSLEAIMARVLALRGEGDEQ